ncbi:hypothetical protein KAW80_03535 [Candidatus Babeliales bacterium]|nr:hypothetical protein [Candidatus Babeliales bacterium]
MVTNLTYTVSFIFKINRNRIIKFILITFLSANFLRADSIIDGNGNRFALTETGTLLIKSGQRVTLKNLILDGVQGERLIMKDGTSQLVLHDSKIILLNDYSFSQGSMEIINNSSIEGEFTFTFSGHNLLIRDTSELKIGNNTTFVCTPTSQIRTPIRFQGATSTLHLENAIFKNNNSVNGIVFANGNFKISGSSTLDSAGTSLNSLTTPLTLINQLNVASSQNINMCIWSPNSRYLIFGSDSDGGANPEIKIFQPPKMAKTPELILENGTINLEKDISINSIEIQI